MKTIDEIIQEILKEEGEEDLPLLSDDEEVYVNDEKIDNEEVNNYVKMKKGRYRNKQVKFSLTENEYMLFKEKLAKDNLTIQKKLHEFVINYILE